MSQEHWPNDMIIRRGRASDIEAMLELKKSLAMERDDSGEQGGFLLGSSREDYRALCAAERILLLEIDGELAGLASSLDDATFRASDVWERREQVDWIDFAPEEVESERVGYFDQLAIAPDFQGHYFGAMLALGTIQRLFASDHTHIFATTVVEPVTNQAAEPLMQKVKARPVGRIKEEYPDVGAITSRIHLIERERCRGALRKLARSGSELEQATINDVQTTVEPGIEPQ